MPSIFIPVVTFDLDYTVVVSIAHGPDRNSKRPPSGIQCDLDDFSLVHNRKPANRETLKSMGNIALP